MRMNNYATALSDLDKGHYASTNYVHALMNRGDLIIILLPLTEKRLLLIMIEYRAWST